MSDDRGRKGEPDGQVSRRRSLTTSVGRPTVSKLERLHALNTFCFGEGGVFDVAGDRSGSGRNVMYLYDGEMKEGSSPACSCVAGVCVVGVSRIWKPGFVLNALAARW